MRAVATRALSATALSLMVIGLASCSEYGFPTTADAMCGAFGHDCHPECRVTPAPATGSDPHAVNYHIGPVSCPGRYIDEARDRAEHACHEHGLTLATSAPQVADRPAVSPLPAARSVTFQCRSESEARG